MSQDTAQDGPWRLDPNGFLRWRETGCKAFRIDVEGTIWIWDKKVKTERPLTQDDVERYVWLRRTLS